MRNRLRLLALGVATIVVLLALLQPRLARGTLAHPPESGDGPDYDVVAFSISRGLGFGYAWDEPDWRAPYERDNRAGKWDHLLQRHGAYTPTAYRPPALPAVLAAIYATAGRDFRIWRIVEAALVAAAVALAASVAWRTAGALAALVLVLLTLRDERLVRASTQYMTEGLAVLGITVLVWALVRFADSQRRRFALAAGLTLGALVLTRNVFVLWYPFVLVLVAGLAWRGPVAGRKRRAAAAAAIALLGALALPAPWWVRNCLLLDAFMPLGTQGGAALVHGYSDYALASRGVFAEDAYAVFAPIAGRVAHLPPILVEREHARFGARFARQWIREHPRQTIALAGLKIRRLWEPDLRSGWPVLLAAALGMAAVGRRRAAVAATLLGANTAAVGATHVVADDRFNLPVHLVLLWLAGAGVAWLAALAGKRRRAAARFDAPDTRDYSPPHDSP